MATKPPVYSERYALEAARESRGVWTAGDDLENVAIALRTLAAYEADVGPRLGPPYELLENLGGAALVDLQLRSAFPRWIAALQLRGPHARVPGSFGVRDG